jgi:membrane associated rhomboid family serine protease
MLLPLRHENMEGRRWPVVTITLIALNVLIFLGTHWKMDDEAAQEVPVRKQILIFAATHPEMPIADEDVNQWVNSVRSANPKAWQQFQSQNRVLRDPVTDQDGSATETASLQEEMNSLVEQLHQLEAVSVRHRFAFYPAHPTVTSYITANFLHAGFLHIIGNMWFLWLAGFILEDTWGRIIYPIVYLLAGAVALQVHAWSNPGSYVATIGASGAVAGLMGAFLSRFPTMKIHMIWILGIFRAYRFKAAAYWLLPAWLLMEVFYGSLFGAASGVAHWAHVGGFVFGAAVGYGIRRSGLEHIAEQGIQEKISWVSHPLLAEANEQLEQGKLDEAAANIKKLLAEKPDSVEAYRMLQQILWRKSDVPGRREVLQKLVELTVKAKDTEESLRSYEDFKSAGGEQLPAAVWLDLCRLIDDHQDLHRAVSEYEALAAAYPNQKQALLANMAAGRICLKRLSESQRALKFYQAAAASPVPHLDWEPTISSGIEQAQKTLSVSYSSPVKS